MKQNVPTNLHSEKLLLDIEANQSKIISFYEKEDIRDYGAVVNEGGKWTINYRGLCAYVADIGYIRLMSNEEDASYSLYKFDMDIGFYKQTTFDMLVEVLIRELQTNYEELRQIPVKFKASVELNIIPMLPTADELFKVKEFEELEEFYTDGEVIPFKNGFYSIRYNRFLPRTSCIFVMNPLNVNFNPESLYNTIGDRYFEMIGDDDCFEYLFEQMGYALYATKFILPTYTVLYGSGANGKSIVVDTLSRILGEPNISRVSLEDMTDPHTVAQAENKRVNIVTDAGAGFRDSAYKSISAVPAFMKTASAGEKWMFNPKYKAPHAGNPPSKFIFASNNYLNFGDSSDGTNRRLHAISFNQTFKEDFALVQAFKGKAETEWFAMRALVGFMNMIHNAMDGAEFSPGVQLKGSYIKCECGKETKLEMIIGNSVVEDFLYNELGLDVMDKDAVREGLLGYENLYDDLRNYCDEVGRKCVSQTKLTQHLKSHYKLSNVRTTYYEFGNRYHKYVVKDAGQKNINTSTTIDG